MSRRVGSRQGRPQRNAKGLTKSRMGHSSLRTGKPCTRGGIPKAKAPRLRKDRNKGTQRTRKLSTVHTVYAGEMRRNASWHRLWRRTAGVAPCAVKVARTVLNGGDEETGHMALRLVPTQLRRTPMQDSGPGNVGQRSLGLSAKQTMWMRGVCGRALKPPCHVGRLWGDNACRSLTANRTREIRPSGMRGGLTET